MRTQYFLLNLTIFILLFSPTGFCADEFAYQESWLEPDGLVNAKSLGLPGTWSIEKQVLQGGKQDGVEVIALNNGKLELIVVPTRGMSIWEVRCGDLRIGWDSPVKEIVHPKYVNLESRGGLGWLDGFGGWFVRCGLEYAGLPGSDEAPSNTGAIVPIDLTLHGKIDYTPASRVDVTVDKEAPHTLVVSGIVNESLMFGPNLQVQTKISTVPNTLQFQVSDTIINNSGHDSEMEIIYHLNFGRPLLEEGSRFVAPLDRITPRDTRAVEGIADAFLYGPPQPNYIEQVYFLKPRATNSGQTEVFLRNAGGDTGVSMKYSTNALPCLTLWKNTTSEADGYVTGIEPGTNYPNNRKIERKNGRISVLKPGEKRDFSLGFEIALDEESVNAIEARIKQIQGSYVAELDLEPVEGISY
ncbi:MAG: aldose 1-epimerase family protein [bacterium]